MATFDSQSYNGRYMRLTVTESDLDAVNNRSKVNWNVTVYGANGSWYSSTVYLAINGSQQLSTSWVDPPQGYFPMVNGTSQSGSLWVTHDASGAKSVSVVFNVRIYYYAEQAHGGTFTLTTLDRNAPTITTDTPTNITVSSASVKVNSNVTCSQWAYQIKTASGSYGAWTYETAEASTHTFSITGLSTNTSYTVNCAGKKKTNDVWGYKEVSFKTLGSATITNMSNATIGATNGLTVEWTPLDSTHRFTLQFMCNGWSYTTGWISPASTNPYSYRYTLPMAICNNIPNSTTGTLMAVLTTYDSNDTQIGNSSTRTSTITVPSSVVPIFNSINIYEGTQSSFGVFVKTLSTVKATVNSGGAYSSTITAISMKVEGSVYNATLQTGIVESGILQTYSTGTGVPIQFTITDSRGRTATDTRYILVYDYYPPTISATATVYGTTITTNAQGSIAPVNNQNQKRLVITRRRIVDSGNTGTYTQNPLDAYNYNKTWTQTISDAGRETYEYIATVYDKLNSASVTIQTGVIALSRHAGGDGITFFGEALDAGFYIVDSGNYIRHDITSAEYLELANMLAQNYSVSASYFVGEFTKYNSKVWECNTAITGGETWNANHWTEVSV